MACLGDLFHYIDCIHAARPGGLGSFSIETLWSATVRPICFLLQQRRKRPNIGPAALARSRKRKLTLLLDEA